MKTDHRIKGGGEVGWASVGILELRTWENNGTWEHTTNMWLLGGSCLREPSWAPGCEVAHHFPLSFWCCSQIPPMPSPPSCKFKPQTLGWHEDKCLKTRSFRVNESLTPLTKVALLWGWVYSRKIFKTSRPTVQCLTTQASTVLHDKDVRYPMTPHGIMRLWASRCHEAQSHVRQCALEIGSAPISECSYSHASARITLRPVLSPTTRGTKLGYI